MNNFFKGLLVGVGVGMLIAPMRGEEMRKMLSERFEELRGQLPENEQIALYKQRVTERVSQTADNLKSYAKQAGSTVKQTASNLKNTAQKAGEDVKSTGRDVTQETKETIKATPSQQ
ncbi:gas vesicle protein [Thermosporothrix hazakensis]|jgi:gas vesicle protein|uniref:Gas vesicle protein n=2 Tax=Thermosporothrix TaxID=768650 RepID=A0A326UBP0_THEHA|nr:YtxH domain-containing protein [Thermosporothrix hazakensis]PZW36032.1 gas vesicle protein [Thermosporothrix hazakensis]BBH88499.1 hypothetical protein KTC_32500 [Thermosporothrix sp. COM3]GCE46684.1 hypothetical protein KTH_15530 [Thermosporothrix hazakensis]